MSFGEFCDYEIDEEHCLLHFFSTADQMNLETYFLDGVSFDGTYKTNNESIYWYQVVAFDMNLMEIPVCIAFISHETSVSPSQFLSYFKRPTNNQELVDIVPDDSSAIAAATTRVYPNSHYILCRVHLIRSDINRVSYSLIDINRKL